MILGFPQIKYMTIGIVVVSLAGLLAVFYGFSAVVNFFLILLALEVAAIIFLYTLGYRSGLFVSGYWPVLSKPLIKKFITHGFDPELGWSRKANTHKVDAGKPYSIDARGSRAAPGHEDFSTMISVYGDSYAFCRECADNETWPWHLGELTKTHVLNFGVGNYGLDQALLRLEREYPKNPTPVVIMAVVPETVSRNYTCWKHLYEFGNILGFKPKYDLLENGRLELRKYPLRDDEDFCHFKERVQHQVLKDPFYQNVFLHEAIVAPHFFGLILQYKTLAVFLLKSVRQICMRFKLNTEFLDHAIIMMTRRKGPVGNAQVYQDQAATDLTLALIKRFRILGEQMGFEPVLVILPMRDDLVYNKYHRNYYSDFVSQAKNICATVDLTDELAGRESRKIFVRWHYSSQGNAVVAQRLATFLSSTMAVKKSQESRNKIAG